MRTIACAEVRAAIADDVSSYPDVYARYRRVEEQRRRLEIRRSTPRRSNRKAK